MDSNIIVIQSRELVHDAEVVSPILTGYIRKMNRWGVERGISRENGASPVSQVEKLVEEADEIVDAWNAGDADKLADGIGDCLTVLVQIARLAGVSLDDAAARAWRDIKDRKGKLCHGIFVKQSDIDALEVQGKSLDSIMSARELEESLQCISQPN